MYLPVSCYLIDPPWPTPGGGGRGSNCKYKLLKLDEIAPTIMGSGVWNPADSCHLWIWSPRQIGHCLQVINELGFEQQSFAIWAKRGAPGLGRYLRYKGELLLLATRGKAMIPDVAPEGLIWTEYDTEVPLIEHDRARGADGKIIHSRKPYAFHDLIEKVSPGPYVEMFAREQRPGWTVWGDEVREEVMVSAGR